MVRHSTRPRSAPERDIPEAAALPDDQRARRQRVIEAAGRLMVTEDYGKIQVKDVAEGGGVSLGTLYRYFSSKDHLFACALTDWARAETGPGSAPAARAHPDGTPEERMRAVVHTAAQAFEKAPRVYGAIMQLQVSADRYARDEFWAFSGRQLDAFAEAVADVPEPYRDDIVSVVSSVLAESLRGYVTGLFPISGVYERLDRTVRLAFRAPFA